MLLFFFGFSLIFSMLICLLLGGLEKFGKSARSLNRLSKLWGAVLQYVVVTLETWPSEGIG